LATLAVVIANEPPPPPPDPVPLPDPEPLPEPEFAIETVKALLVVVGGLEESVACTVNV
jgi:hypothetical protein